MATQTAQDDLDAEVGKAGGMVAVNVSSEDASRTLSGALGDVSACQIVYQDLKYSVKVKEKGNKTLVNKQIIKDISGVIQPGRLTAVMGASGAGKTTFLNMLAGFVKDEATVSGEISVNGEVMQGNRMRQLSGYVHQEDVILDTVTVREALMFAAELRLPRDMSRTEKERRAMDIADLLNLRKALDNVVGSTLIKGISGGEKRRLSIGQQLITNPGILFLDEPTSGLDSYTAYKVCRILRQVAHRHNRTVCATIHQPSSEVFSLFDDVIVLAEGQVVFHGPVPDMVKYFGDLGYQCPPYYNMADYLFMEILNTGSNNGEDAYDFTSASKEDEASKHQAREAEQARIQGLISSWQGSQLHASLQKSLRRGDTMQHGVHESVVLMQAPWYTQFKLLAIRAQKNAWRNQLILKAKLGQAVFLSIVCGLIWLRVGDDHKGIQDREGSLFFITVQGLFGSVLGTLNVFGAEKTVFQREYASRYYSLGPYFWSRTLTSVPSMILTPLLSTSVVYFMIGYQAIASKFWWFALILILMDSSGTSLGILAACCFGDLAVALAVMPMFLLPLMVFSGFFANVDTLGWWFRWISYISPMKYGFIALVKNEFSGLELSCDPAKGGNCSPQGIRPGEDVITELGFDSLGSIGQNAGVLFALMWNLVYVSDKWHGLSCVHLRRGFLLVAYIALWVSIRHAHV